MRPANFPGRKNERRIDALARLTKSISKTVDPERLAAIHNEMRFLGAIIVPVSVARSIRTKKDRSARARLRA